MIQNILESTEKNYDQRKYYLTIQVVIKTTKLRRFLFVRILQELVPNTFAQHNYSNSCDTFSFRQF